jgi:4-amino-4-deoxy-L-arabinose transferase-like glycosyltransferase
VPDADSSLEARAADKAAQQAERMSIAITQERAKSAADTTQNQTARFLVLALLAALLLFPGLRRQGLAGYDDSYFAHEGKEMIRTGDWWNVRFNGDFILSHPPLFPWLEAGSFKLFGVNDSAAKFPTALLGFATILLMYLLTLELMGDIWLAILAMLVLASTQFFLKNASHAMTDVPFTFFFALGILFYLKGLKINSYLALMGLPLALAVLTRSVVGLLALGIVFAHLLLTTRYKLLLSPWFVCGLALTLTIPAIWYVSQYRLHGSAFFLSHLQFLNSKLHPEEGPGRWSTVFNYPLMLLKSYWPWLPFLVTGAVMETRAAIRKKDSIAILLIVWVLMILLPFSVAETRYPRYIMAVFPAFSVLSAMALNRLVPVARRALVFDSACVLLAVAACLTFLFPPKSRADDIVKLAPIAEANSSPAQRILIYTYEDGRTDYQYQFVWYSNRNTQVPENLNDLANTLQHTETATVIVDKQSYAKLLPLITAKNPQILGESANLICFRTQ